MLQAPKTLKDLIIQYQENRKINTQKEINQTSKFKTFISSFITDLLVFIVAILTVLIMFIVIYMFTGQSKLKTLVANITLQRVKAIDSLNTNNQNKQKLRFRNVKISNDLEPINGNNNNSSEDQK